MTQEVYTPKDIMGKLGISRNTVYKLLRYAPFPAIRIGKTYRIPRKEFDEWLNQK